MEPSSSVPLIADENEGRPGTRRKLNKESYEKSLRTLPSNSFPRFSVDSFLDFSLAFIVTIFPYKIWESVYSLRGSVKLRPHLIWVCQRKGTM